MVKEFRLDFDNIKLSATSENTLFKEKSSLRVSKKDIAIIGLSCTFGHTKNKDEFWNMLEEGEDGVRPLSQERRRLIENYVKQGGSSASSVENYIEKAYLEEIDRFDYQLFSLSPAESNLIDPNQRIFLENVWSAIEDAGYGGNKLAGTKTGVYVGHCNISLDEYLRFIEVADPKLFTIAVPGNIKSIIASRISNLLDLRGPALVVDTACSSSLTAVHLACQAIRNSECEMALAGGVKLTLIPGQNSETEDIGIASSDGRTRSFDSSSTGTGGGEGAGVVLLKPLQKALEDGDSIYAVIKGSSINQDGKSLGITAPNSVAQEEVIVAAWEDAGIDPATISYMEAHGTGTKLGDPVEINGLERAFQRFTNKQQFCAIGSVKTNIGHLDGAAGIAGLIKAILAIKHKKIPPNLHFQEPNRNISFITSPVYINDQLCDWTTDGVPLRCGVSSFGLSGTNAHVVLEEAPPVEMDTFIDNEEDSFQILTLSAKYKDGLQRLVEQYEQYVLHEHVGKDLKNICYTSQTGRGHYQYRVALLAQTKDQLASLLTSISTNGLGDTDESGYFYGTNRIVSDQKESRGTGELTEEEKRKKSYEANQLIQHNHKEWNQLKWEKLCQLYVEGAEIEWDLLHRNKRIKRVHAPVYPFARHRCWVEGQGKPSSYAQQGNSGDVRKGMHPLIDQCLVDSMEINIYSTQFSADKHWELREHVLGGYPILPGTCYLEIASELGKEILGSRNIELQDILFISPLIVPFNEMIEVQTIIKKIQDHQEFAIVSKSKETGQWTKHVEGKIYPVTRSKEISTSFDIQQVKKNSITTLLINDELLAEAHVQTGKRWRNIHKLYLGEDEVMAELLFPLESAHELEHYFLYPSLLDGAVNAANGTMGEGLFLPLHYEKARFYQPIPRRFYSYLKKKDLSKGTNDIATFDITLVNEQGVIIGEIENYTIKKFHEFQTKLHQLSGKTSLYHKTIWSKEPLADFAPTLHQSVLLFTDRSDKSETIAQKLKEKGTTVIEVTYGKSFYKHDEHKVTISDNEDDYIQLVQIMNQHHVSQIVHMWNIDHSEDIREEEELQQALHKGVMSLFSLTKELVRQKINRIIDIVLLSSTGYAVSQNDQLIHPHHASMYGLGKVIEHEYSNLQVRSIDVDEYTKAETILQEILQKKKTYTVAYRQDDRYVEEFIETTLNKHENVDFHINPSGVYVITGASGGIGIELSKYLASQSDVHLAWLSRTILPDRNTWSDFLNGQKDGKITRMIRAILELEASGSTVDYFSVDLTNGERLADVLQQMRQTYGKINGIIHCAGLAGDGFLIKKEARVFTDVVKPKILGTWLLDSLTKQDHLDFFVLCSSLTSVFGAPGQSDYTAANAYQDSFAAYRNRLGKPALTINWSGWSETGMAVDHGVHLSRSMFVPLQTRNGIEAFGHVIKKRLDRIMIGQMDDEMIIPSLNALPIVLSKSLTDRLDQKSIEQTKLQEKEHSRKGDTELSITGKDKASLSETEKTVARLWGQVLGLSEIDVYDKFFELGGDSLLASHLLKEMEKVYPGLLDITDVFIYATIVEMAAFIDQKQKPVQTTRIAKADIEKDIDLLLQKVSLGLQD
ncbi:KR domain-containing protein [Brevibacillus laterosporus]|uniref:KR domain-containing protein n=1 Tax=Brevibacillus laterosporus TaxID=1465 RepID=A0A518VAZ0_BRELA|nr:KR domain-containing protein [Brevibacillus laterosporus]